MAHKQQGRRRSGGHRERRIVVRGIRRDHPDLHKLSRALIALAQAQAEKEAEQQQRATDASPTGGDADDG